MRERSLRLARERREQAASAPDSSSSGASELPFVSTSSPSSRTFRPLPVDDLARGAATHPDAVADADALLGRDDGTSRSFLGGHPAPLTDKARHDVEKLKRATEHVVQVLKERQGKGRTAAKLALLPDDATPQASRNAMVLLDTHDIPAYLDRIRKVMKHVTPAIVKRLKETIEVHEPSQDELQEMKHAHKILHTHKHVIAHLKDHPEYAAELKIDLQLYHKEHGDKYDQLNA